MTALSSTCFRVAFLTLWLAAPTGLFSQSVNELPRAEYYLARELYRAGRIQEAAEGFKTALGRARRVGEQGWVDSIPPLIMLGECYYQLGNLGLAMEHYDRALMIALAHPSWIDQIDVPPEPLAELESSSKGIHWFAKSGPSKAVIVPAGIQIAIDPTQAQVTPQGTVVAPVSLVTSLDVSEVLRTLGIALMRRWEVLGPLAKHSPLAKPLEALFARNPSRPVPWLVASWRVLQGISSLSSPTGGDSRQLLRSGTLIGNQADYFLSSLALLVLGKLDAREGNYASAIIHFQDASLLAAQFEQYGLVCESIERLSACAAASGRIELLDPLQRLATWANKNSGSVQVEALLAAGELSIYKSDYTQADKVLRQCATVLRGRETDLPRVQAQLLFTSSLLAFGQNRSTLGVSNLENALNIMRGSSSTGAVVESIFQTQLTLDLLASQSLTAPHAEAILMETCAEPTAIDWELAPLKTIAELTTARDPAYVRLLELAVARQAPIEELVGLLDRIQRQRLFEALPLGGRQFAWRTALQMDPAQLTPATRQVVDATRQRFPSLLSTRDRMNVLVAQLRQAPLPMDDRKLPADTKRAFVELEELATNYENQLAFQSLQRRALERVAPPPAQLAALQSQLAERDLVLAMVAAGQQVFGLAITRDNTHVWHLNDGAKIDAGLTTLLKEIGLVSDGKPAQPSQVASADAAWCQSAAQLSGSLFPAEVQDLLAECTRVIMIPHDRLWYVPYELLPQRAVRGKAPWVAHHAVTYVPTLGSIAMAFAAPPVVKDTVGVIDSFFALDPSSNQEQAAAILQSVPDSHGLVLNPKVALPAAAWLKLRTDQLWVAATLDSSNSDWDSPLLPFGNASQSSRGAWFLSPHTSPPRVLLPGLRTGMRQGNLTNGNDIFLPICGLLHSGTKFVALNRWPVGGKSAKAFLQRQLEELQSERPSDALRRSTLAQWTEQFLVADEPTLLPAVKETAPLVSGFHPLLWSGTMSVGDYQLNP